MAEAWTGITTSTHAKQKFWWHVLSNTSVRLVPSGGVHLSDRERAGLRGPVRTCIEESTAHDGSSVLTTTEYGLEGNLLTNRFGDRIGSAWFSAYTYDDRGRLAKITSGKLGEIANEMLYAYDDAGRSLSITNTENADRTDFHYDEQDRKTAVKSFDPKTLERLQNSAHTCSTWEAALVGFGVPAGGTVATVYDENDRPVEVQIRDAEGQPVSRVVRSYNVAGLITDEKPTWENPAPVLLDRFPPEQRDRMTPEQVQLLSKSMSAMLGGKAQAGTAYAYDAQGRTKTIRERTFVFERTTTIACNDQGDKTEECTTTIGNSVIPIGVPHSIGEDGTLVPNDVRSEAPTPFAIPEKSVIHYFYQYDDRRNWIVQTATCEGRSTERRRNLTYY